LNFKKETLKSHKINANNTRIKAFLKLDEVLEKILPFSTNLFSSFCCDFNSAFKYLENRKFITKPELSLQENWHIFLPFINGLGHQGFLLQFSF
jgi:hypothetical protein